MYGSLPRITLVRMRSEHRPTVIIGNGAFSVFVLVFVGSPFLFVSFLIKQVLGLSKLLVIEKENNGIEGGFAYRSCFHAALFTRYK